MTLDRDPMADRLVEAWLDEGPRTFAPGRLDRTLADIHGTPQRRQRPLPWSAPRMNLAFFTGLAGAAVLAVLFAAGALLPWLPATILGPATTPTPPPTVDASPVPTVAPAPTFLAGDVPFEGTDWLLVGRSDGDWGARTGGPAFVSPGVHAWLRISGGTFIGSDGCSDMDGVWPAYPDGDRTTPIAITPVWQGESGPCRGTEDGKISTLLQRTGAFQVTGGGYDLLASDLADADLDPALLAHYQANPDLVRLIIRDQSGEGTLVYAPVAPGFVVEPPQVGFVGPLWGLVGYADGGTPQDSPVSARTASIQLAGDGTFAGSVGCGPITGRWGVEEDQGTVRWGPWVVDQEAVPDGCTIAGAQAVLDALRSVDISTVSVTTAPVRELPAAWADVFGTFEGRESSAFLVLRDGAGDPVLLYTQLSPDDASPAPSAPASASLSPTSQPTPSPTFIEGKVPLVGTAWRLVGRIDGERADGDPAYISPVGDRPAMLRFGSDEGWAGDSGCRVLQGSWDATPKHGSTFPADLKGGAWHEIPCTTPASSQDKSVISDLNFAGGMQITAGGYDLLASGLTDADLDPELLSHYQANPDLVRLLIRDQSGEGTLIYAPVAPDLGDLVGGWWQIAGYRSDDGTLVTTADPAALIRFDSDGTFSVTDGCATLDGTWGARPVPDATPAPGDVNVDVSRSGDDCDATLRDTLTFLLGEADLGLGVIQTHDPASWLYPDDASPELLARFAAGPDADWIWVRDAELMEVLVLTPAEEAPDPTPSPVPGPEVAFTVGDVPLAGTTWMIVGYQATFDNAAGPTYAAVLPSTTPYLRISDAGLVVASFGGCDAVTARTVRDPSDAGTGPLFEWTDGADTGGCSPAAVRQGARLQSLFGQVAALERVAPGMPELAPGITDERVAQALRDHFGAMPDVGHLVLRDGTGDANALLILAPVAGNLDPAVQPYPDPAPGRQPAPDLAGDRALTDDAWMLVGWRDADGRMRMDGWDWTTQLVFAAGEGTTSGVFSGTIPCGVIDGQWTGAILDAATGGGPFTFSEVTADPAPDCNAAMLPQIDAIRSGLEGAASVALGPQEVQLDIAGVPKTEMDPWLWAWLAANQDARLLVVRDADGATSLILAPVAASDDAARPSPAALGPPTFQGVPLLTKDVPAVDSTWMLAGYVPSPSRYLNLVDPAHPAGLRFSDAGLMVASNGCDSLAGAWTATPSADVTIPDGARPFAPSPFLDTASHACTSTKDSGQVERLLERTVSLQVVDDLSAVVSPDTATGQLVDATRDLPGVRALGARNAIGAVTLVYLPAAGPLDTPLPLPDGAAPVPPPTEPVAGVVEPAAVNWLLVGWRSPDGTMWLADFTAPVELRISPGGALELGTQCGYVAGTWEADAPGATGTRT